MVEEEGSCVYWNEERPMKVIRRSEHVFYEMSISNGYL